MSRENILKKIEEIRFPDVPLPKISDLSQRYTIEDFVETVTSNGAKVIRSSDYFDERRLQTLFPDYTKVLVGQDIPNLAERSLNKLKDLAETEVAVIAGKFGVAENGAIWVEERSMIHRAVPFITQHLVLVVQERMIVPTMHEAYAMIDARDGYGVFISGPSKTADIEQSLVVGAHGALSLTVVLK